MTVPDPNATSGKVSTWVALIKGLTISNAIVIILLAFVVLPGYVLYRTMNDEKLLDRFMSNYSEESSQLSGCTQRMGQERGGTTHYSVSTGFAYQGSDRWVVSVWMDHDLSVEQIEAYCNALKGLVDFMRDPLGKSPPFPGSDVPIVRQWQREPPGKDQ